jgi:glycosyltransferase involved in cell wall biosynthesis/peptidoglycan/xylan/chitin deacetylase (PgdA/CDA1 family)
MLVDSLRTGGAELMLAELAGAGDTAGIQLSVGYLDGPPGHAADRLRLHGVEPELVSLPGHLGPRALSRVMSHVAEIGPDVLHTHLTYADLLGGIAGRRLAVPTVSTVHAVSWGRGRDAVRARLAALVRRWCCDRVITVSEAARRAYLARRWDRPERVVSVPNGIEGQPAAGRGPLIRSDLGIARDAPVITMVSVLRPEKGHETVLAALPLLRQRFPELCLIIAGDGPLRSRIQALASPHGDAVRMLGDRDDVMALLDATDVLVHPSRHDAFPTTLLEAMAASVAVVATAVGGIPEIVQDGVTGTLLKPPPSPSAVAEAIGDLLADRQRCVTFGTEARRRFDLEFGLQRWAQRLGVVYRQVASPESSAPAMSPSGGTLGSGSGRSPSRSGEGLASRINLDKHRRAAWLIDRSGLGGVLRSLPAWRGTLVLNYHRIARSGEVAHDRGVVSASPEEFLDQMRYLRRHFEVVGPEELVRHPERPGKRVLITFDDGYRDNFELALPILEDQGVRATFFLTTGFLDDPRLSWWDEIAWMVRNSPKRGFTGGHPLPEPLIFDEPHRDAAVAVVLKHYKQLRPGASEVFLDHVAEATGTGRGDRRDAIGMWMTWDMARQMRDAGMVLGGHTVNHPVLARLTPESQRQEVEGCRARLAAELSQPMDWFSYPVGERGSFDAVTRNALQQAGVRAAFSFYGGFQRIQGWDPFDVPRSAVMATMTRAQVRALPVLPQVFARW